MTPANQMSWRGAVSALVQSYAADLRGWAAGIAIGYALAVVLLVLGFLAILAAIGDGVALLFHVIAVRHGLDFAYAVVGGGLFVIGLILLLAAWAVLKRRKPPIPRPVRQAQAARRLMIRPSVLGAVTRLREGNGRGARQIKPVLIGAAATALLYWIVASRIRARSEPRAGRGSDIR